MRAGLAAAVVAMLLADRALADAPGAKTEKDELLWMLGGSSQAVARFESADKSAKVDVLHRSSAQSVIWGMSLKAGVDNDLGDLFSGGSLAPKAEFTARTGWVNLTTDRADTTTGDVDWFVIRLTAAAQKVVLFDRKAAFDKQIKKRVFAAPGLEMRYAYFFGAKQLIVSPFARIQRETNLDKLDEVEITTERASTDSVSGATRKAQSKTTAHVGDYAEHTVAPLGIEIFHKLPAELLGTSVAIIAKPTWHARSEYEASGGLFLLKKGEPANGTVGLAVAFTDIGHGRLKDQFSVGAVLNLKVGP